MGNRITALKPCPFCGAEAEIVDRENTNPQGGRQFTARCTNPKCICKPTTWRVSLYDVVSLWNHRATEGGK